MEDRIKEYEKYLEKELKSAKDDKSRKKLWKYHRAMLKDFQHERAIHMAVMFFFVVMALAVIVLDCALITTISHDVTGNGVKFIDTVFKPDITCGFWVLWPLHLLSLLLTGLSIAYVKHYYFLETHIQKLYDQTKKLL